jgi:murein hydrolase activator
MSTLKRFGFAAALGALALEAILGRPAAGQDLGSSAPPKAAGDQAGAPETAEKTRREEDLKALQEEIARSAEAQRLLDREIAALAADRAKLSAALIDATRRMHATEERIRSLEQRLQTTGASESAIRRSLDARRGVLVEVLAALQRIGRRPAPAVLVRPEDILQAVRTSMLLGAVLPELRAEAEILAADLGELVRLRGLMAGDREVLKGELAGLSREQDRLAALVAARQGRGAEAERMAALERDRALELGAKATSLKELIERMERESAAVQRDVDETKRAAEARARETRERFAAAAVRDPVRLAPKIPFSEARGLLARPASGEILRAFGAPDGSGGTTRGVSIATRPRAVVSAPADGWVAFAGPFRSFGRLLIISAGGGYYLLLAGMDQVSVEVGQFVLAGEPVGTMRDASLMSPVSGAIETNDPILYVEFRKDGGSIDPAPWWAKSQGEKVRG